MNENFVKICVVCNTEKKFDNFYNKNRECKACKIKRVLKQYSDDKEKNYNNVEIYVHVLKSWIID